VFWQTKRKEYTAAVVIHCFS